jgi:hypothetical protein
MSGRKGQLVFEFVVAAIFFFYIVFYVINYLNATAMIFSSDFYMNSLEFKAIEISELLLHNRGVWNGTVPETPGLADGWPVLNTTKIQYMDAYCSSPINYEVVLRKLDINSSRGHGMKIELNDTGGNLMLCGYLPGGFINAKVERFAISDTGEYLTMTVWAW